MNYYELTFTILPNTETNRDLLSAVLGGVDFESFTESPSGICAYVREKDYNVEHVKIALSSFPIENVELSFTEEKIISQDWNQEWEKNFFKAIVIDDQCVVHSSFHKDIPKLPYQIMIDPKMAFGTGHHETTSLMISHLLQTPLSGKSFLDMGCGTAVLAILAHKRGASPILAIDIDQWAYQNSIDNIALNKADDIQLACGDAELLKNKKFDIIFANINRNILLTDIPLYAQCMEKGGLLFMSGFYAQDMDMIKEKCTEFELKYISSSEKNEWVALKFEKIR
ncbi:ribosomal protein L11 methyltransferase [Bacteroidales bacterium]|nr:ribosomal protein L11 methyltransferase [Bacteroidales bacterium]